MNHIPLEESELINTNLKSFDSGCSNFCFRFGEVAAGPALEAGAAVPRVEEVGEVSPAVVVFLPEVARRK